MQTINKYFGSTLIFTLLSLVVAALFLGGYSAALTVAILAVLEISLSFDNAVVNAKALANMNDIWKKRFLTWGMVIAVFGMRVVFPLLIVSIVASISPWAALHMALFEADKYAATLTSAEVSIAGFGMSFLMMVFLKFFFDKEKEVHWIGFIEKHLKHLEATEIAATLGVTYLISTFLEAHESYQFIVAALFGLVTFVMVEWLGEFLSEEGDGKDATVAVAKAGLGAFIYLEILDASFSFDGVIGAFALTNNIFIIALGLGSGAFAVRGMTLMLVDKGTLAEFRYLEHGAFYAIGILATLMGVSTFHEVPEIVTGLLGAGFIAAAVISSIIHNKRSIK